MSPAPLSASLRAMRAAHRDEHVEHEHDMHGSMARRARAGLRWRPHPSHAKRASARAPSNFVPCGSWQLRSAPQRRKQQLFNGRRDRDRCLNRGSAQHSCAPDSTSGVPSIGCRGAARAFDRGKPHFSEKLTAMNVNAYLAVQHIDRKYDNQLVFALPTSNWSLSECGM